MLARRPVAHVPRRGMLRQSLRNSRAGAAGHSDVGERFEGLRRTPGVGSARGGSCVFHPCGRCAPPGPSCLRTVREGHRQAETGTGGESSLRRWPVLSVRSHWGLQAELPEDWVRRLPHPHLTRASAAMHAHTPPHGLGGLQCRRAEWHLGVPCGWTMWACCVVTHEEFAFVWVET